MRITLYLTGKTAMPFVEEGMQLYAKRMANYCKFSTLVLAAVKNAASMPANELKLKEGELILKAMESNSLNILLDENGKEMDSAAFASFLQGKMNMGIQSLAFFVGGAYGFDKSVKEKADICLSLSKMTFSHQIIRVIFLEQLYRAFTILRNEPYHNA